MVMMQITDRPFRNAAASFGPLFAVTLLLASGSLSTRNAYAQQNIDGKGPAVESKSPTQEAQAPASQDKPLRLMYAGKTLSPEVAPYRDPVDGAICIPVEALEPLGIVSQFDSAQNRVAITTTDGTSSTLTVPRVPPAGYKLGDYKGVFIPAEVVITTLGGKCDFDPATNTLTFRSILKGVDVENGKVRVRTSLPVVPIVSRENGGKLLIIDLPGTDFANLPKPVITLPNLKDARVGQYKPDMGRVVLEFSTPTVYSVENTRSSTLLTFVPGPLRPVPVASQPGSRPVASAKPKKPTPKPSATPSAPATIKAVEFYSMSPQRAQFVIKADRTPLTSASQSRGRLSLNLNNVTLSPEANAALSKIEHPFLKSVPTLNGDGKSAQLVLDLNRIVSFYVMADGQGNILLDIALPKSAGGKLAGKTVVVDAGHGGTDKGAPGVNGTNEKDINLSIAFLVAAELRAAGASVIMARSTDYKVPLYDRPALANQAGADFFISIHCNDPGNGNRSINGSVVYYHGDDNNARTLAQSIAERFEQMGGIRSKGIASDYTVYRGEGFAVLRASRMVGVLIETGFMTNPNDVRLLNDKAMQQKIAVAVVAGLRDYIEGNPQVDTANNNPGVGDSEGTLTLPLNPKPVPAVIPPAVPMPTSPDGSGSR